MTLPAPTPAAPPAVKMSPETLAPRAAAERLGAEGGTLIDVRTPAEFREVHAEGAVNRPLDGFDPAALPADGPTYLICKSGSRSARALTQARAAGRGDVSGVEGGTEAWEAAGLPVVRGRKAVSLERQVRIAAGALAFVGAVLALFVHPYWAGLPAFIGAGLVFAGVTDTCAMGMGLAKMPWNR